MQFKVVADYEPRGDQPTAIAAITRGLQEGARFQTIRGVTGSGKTFTMAKIIEQMQRPTLILSHNKTLAAQLYREFKDFFPHNAVEYFVSYYDYYQPEAYVASKDLYIEKDASINAEIERMRLAATTSLLERPDVIVVATVSCIYGLGSPKNYRNMRLRFDVGQDLNLRELKLGLVRLQYERNDGALDRGRFSVRGDTLDIYPAYEDVLYRLDLDFEQIARIRSLHPVSKELLAEHQSIMLYPAKHFVMPEDEVRLSVEAIQAEMVQAVTALEARGRLVEAQRLKTRTEYDLEMMQEMGYCSGIENYSRHLSGRQAGERPAVLLDYFPDRFLTFVDESHVSLPQVRGMYLGDRSRKQNLVDFGFRLPSAMDNRPLYFEEFENLLNQAVFVSATPGALEMERVKTPVELIIRPTGLLDPELEVRPTMGQIEDLYAEVRRRIAMGDRTLITTLTKKMAEDLSNFLQRMGLKVAWLHAEVETIERVEILTDLRRGTYDVLVGINLLREGLDLPEVSLVAILDADKIGFLRSATSLIQTIGRAARNVNGKVIMYADRMSPAMEEAISETKRRRALQEAYNREHGITPQSVSKLIHTILEREEKAKVEVETLDLQIVKSRYNLLVPKERKALVAELQKRMLEHAKNLEFEAAAIVRDEIEALKQNT
jgi:excinuclease ABC subunit B